METIKYLRVSATTICDAKCWYCFNESQPFDCSTLEDVDGFRWLISQMVSNHGTEIVRFTGGEPLMNPRLVELIKAAKDAGVKRVGLTTNGHSLREKADDLLRLEIDDYAIHLNSVDSMQMNYRREQEFIDWAVEKFPSVKFNIVVTKQYFNSIHSIVDYAIEKGVNLLLLDLLQAGNPDAIFENEYCSLDGIRKLLVERGMAEVRENLNSIVYTDGTSNIKLLEHYSNIDIREAYCTQNLAFHPVLLTPSFSFVTCTHFGKQSISIADVVSQRDGFKLRTTISRTIEMLSRCKDCSNRNVLEDGSK